MTHSVWARNESDDTVELFSTRGREEEKEFPAELQSQRLDGRESTKGNGQLERCYLFGNAAL